MSRINIEYKEKEEPVFTEIKEGDILDVTVHVEENSGYIRQIADLIGMIIIEDNEVYLIEIGGQRECVKLIVEDIEHLCLGIYKEDANGKYPYLYNIRGICDVDIKITDVRR